MSIADCIVEYEKLAREVFANPRAVGAKYDHSELEKVLKRVIREQLRKDQANDHLSDEELENAPLLNEQCCNT